MPNPKPALEARKRPRQARANAMVAAILEGAARILETEGLAALNTNAVAERAGASIGSLYQYFPAKEALLTALIRQERAALMAALRRVRDDAAGRDLTEVLDGFIRAALNHQFTRPALARTLEYAEATLPIDAETEALKREIVAAVADVLRAHDIDDPETAARDLAALTRGMTDAAGLHGETDMLALEPRIRRAVHGYLNLRS
jgi:AcrR family transcriptional regulator